MLLLISIITILLCMLIYDVGRELHQSWLDSPKGKAKTQRKKLAAIEMEKKREVAEKKRPLDQIDPAKLIVPGILWTLGFIMVGSLFIPIIGSVLGLAIGILKIRDDVRAIDHYNRGDASPVSYTKSNNQSDFFFFFWW